MPEGLIATVGRWCFRHRFIVAMLSLGVLVGGGFAAGPVFDRLVAENDAAGFESIEAYRQLGVVDEGELTALVDGVDPRDEAVRRQVTAAAAELAARPDVRGVDFPYTTPERGNLIADDGRALLVTVRLAPGSDDTEEAAMSAAGSRLRALAGELRATGQPDAVVRLGGSDLRDEQAGDLSEQDLQRSELLSLPLTLLVLVFVFGGLIAAGLPVLAAIASVLAAMPVLLAFSYVTDLDSNTVTVVTLLGLGLSIDYGLLLVARYREELGHGFTPEVALGRAWATAGRTIVFSALTVAVALSGLLLFDLSELNAMGAAGVSIALVAMLVALTLTAALLGLARSRIRPAKQRRPQHSLRSEGDGGFFAGLARIVQRFAAPVALLTVAGLLAAGLPLLSATPVLPDLEVLPSRLEPVQVARAESNRFAAHSTPTVIVVADIDPAELTEWAARWRGDPAVAEVRPARPVDNVAVVELALRGTAQDAAARALVDRIRTDRPPNGPSWIGGDAAVLVDVLDTMRAGLPAALGVTLFAMLVLIFLMTGSVVVPVKAVLANVVSLGATLGVLVLVFERGHGANVLHTLTVGGLSPFIVIVVFAFAFGLSMDYELFLLSRVKEYVDAGHDSHTAVRLGLQHTGRIITSAALLMLVVFSCFATAEMGEIEQVGLGLAVAVLIDATVVRCLLVPATMVLLGRRNWWAPRPLAWLHARIGLRETILPAPTPTMPTVLADSRD
ncbi:putative membrane protein [Virgisporangium aliadipatigenens]|uniref:Putative membrane protein n=1 Tax=Virgisporangium aliadipatigenens TaxID=741659 RepID=A0A8J3YNG3_9ACTN|nr:MMPL family transporter [Virgisporangium aliadipatigenens]GIJ48799.1 putative membrane protein [Virgisporangium aliadipatigenens]